MRTGTNKGGVGADRQQGSAAEHLFPSPHTAKTHVNRNMTKPGVRDRAQLVIITSRTDWVPPQHFLLRRDPGCLALEESQPSAPAGMVVMVDPWVWFACVA